MEHGELIKKLRKDRGLTQSQLAEGITSRTALVQFEKGLSRPYFETVEQYLQRLNVTIDEYLYLLNDKERDEKALLHERFYRLFYSDPSGEEMLWLIDETKQRYLETQDMFFLSFYLQALCSVKMVDTLESSALNDEESHLLDVYLEYLEKCETWGRMELTSFATLMFVFSDELIDSTYKKLHRGEATFFKDEKRRRQAIALISNMIVLAFDRKNFDRIPNYLKDLENMTHGGTDFYGQTNLILFKGVYAYRVLGDDAGMELVDRAIKIAELLEAESVVAKFQNMRDEMLEMTAAERRAD